MATGGASRTSPELKSRPAIRGREWPKTFAHLVEVNERVESRGRGIVFELKNLVPGAAANRNQSGVAHGTDTGKRSQMLQHFAIHRAAVLRRIVSVAQIDAGQQDMPRRSNPLSSVSSLKNVVSINPAPTTRSRDNATCRTTSALPRPNFDRFYHAPRIGLHRRLRIHPRALPRRRESE